MLPALGTPANAYKFHTCARRRCCRWRRRARRRRCGWWWPRSWRRPPRRCRRCTTTRTAATPRRAALPGGRGAPHALLTLHRSRPGGRSARSVWLLCTAGMVHGDRQSPARRPAQLEAVCPCSSSLCNVRGCRLCPACRCDQSFLCKQAGQHAAHWQNTYLPMRRSWPPRPGSWSAGRPRRRPRRRPRLRLPRLARGRRATALAQLRRRPVRLRLRDSPVAVGG